MKHVLFQLTLCFLFAPIVAAQVKSDREKSGLAGPVKSVESSRIEYSLKGGKSVEGRRIVSQKTTYNKEGNKTEQLTFDLDGSVSDKTLCDYAPSGMNITCEEYSPIADKNLATPRRHVYTLDNRGNVVEYTGYESNGTLGDKFGYKYDVKGNKTEEVFYSWNGSRMGKLVYSYDDNGNRLTETSYDADDSVSWGNVNSYDATGHRSARLQYQRDLLKYKMVYKKDSNGRITEEETFEFNKPPNTWTSHAPFPGKVTHTYDDAKRTRETISYNEDGSFKEGTIHQLDEKGNEVGWSMFNADGSFRNHEIHWYDKNVKVRTLSGKALVKFDYDPHGNWTRKTHLIKSADSDEPEALSAEYRDITYH